MQIGRRRGNSKASVCNLLNLLRGTKWDLNSDIFGFIFHDFFLQCFVSASGRRSEHHVFMTLRTARKLFTRRCVRRGSLLKSLPKKGIKRRLLAAGCYWLLNIARAEHWRNHPPGGGWRHSATKPWCGCKSCMPLGAAVSIAHRSSSIAKAPGTTGVKTLGLAMSLQCSLLMKLQCYLAKEKMFKGPRSIFTEKTRKETLELKVSKLITSTLKYHEDSFGSIPHVLCSWVM